MVNLEEQREKLGNLWNLIREHPDYPVVAMVDSEIVQEDGYAWWLGGIGDAYTVGIFIGEERMHEYEFPDWEDALDDCPEISEDDIEKAACDEDYAKELYDSLPWVDVIAVKIGMPDF